MNDSYYYYYSSPLREVPPGPQPTPQVVSALQRPAGVGASTRRLAGRDQPTHQAEPAGLILPGGKVFPAVPQARPGHQPLADPPTFLAYLDFGEGLGSPLGGRLVPPGQRGAEPLDLTEVDEEGTLGAVHPEEGVARIRGPACTHPLRRGPAWAREPAPVPPVPSGPPCGMSLGTPRSPRRGSLGPILKVQQGQKQRRETGPGS